MKKLTLSLVVAGLISTSAVASECSTLSEKIGFGAIGVLQGAIIGGPIGAFWGLGTIAFADKVNLCDSNEIKEITPIVNENKNLKEVQKIQVLQEVKQNENLNEIKTVINKEPNYEHRFNPPFHLFWDTQYTESSTALQWVC